MGERKRASCFPLLATAALMMLGCGDATGVIQGGQSLTASDAQSTATSGDAGPSWNDLYTTYFGPTGSATCSGASCHQKGGAAEGFWACGSTASECWNGITVSVVPKGGATDATTTQLYTALRTPSCTAMAATCNMPLLNAFVFQAADLAKVVAWIQAGAPNN
ncbi:MAG: hypothetical protein M3O50_15155 [Myxococcota bacterium]|nr:hypothetical protein [Myxococcota bacterium]